MKKFNSIQTVFCSILIIFIDVDVVVEACSINSSNAMYRLPSTKARSELAVEYISVVELNPW